jgi:hypothetical protein
MSEERSTWIQIRVTPSERAKLHADADAKGLNLSNYVRRRLGLKPAKAGRPRKAT